MTARRFPIKLTPVAVIAERAGLSETVVWRTLESALDKLRPLDPDLDLEYFSSILAGFFGGERRISATSGEAAKHAPPAACSPPSGSSAPRRAGLLSLAPTPRRFPRRSP